MEVIKRASKYVSNLSPKKKFELLLVICLLGTAFFVRTQGIDRGLWQDEAYTIVNYVDKGPLEIATGNDYKPNNHMLFNLAIWAVVSVFGFSEFNVRILAIVSTVMAFLVIYYICRKYLGIRVAIVSLFVLSIGSFNILSTSTARGYGFLLLFSSLFFFFAIRYASHRSKESSQNSKKYSLLGMVTSGFLAAYTYPSFLAIIGMVFLVMLLTEKSKKDLLKGAIIGLGLISIALAPLATSIVKYYVNFGGGFKKHQDLSWEAVIQLPVSKVIETTETIVSPISRFTEPFLGRLNINAIISMLIAGLTLYGIYYLFSKQRTLFYIMFLPTLLFMVFGVGFGVPLGSRPDYTIFLEFNYIIFFAIGVASCLSVLEVSHKLPQRIKQTVCATVGVLILILSVNSVADNTTKNQENIDQAKQSFEFINSKCKSSNCDVIVYAKSTPYQFYARKVLYPSVNYMLSNDETIYRDILAADNNTYVVHEIYRSSFPDKFIGVNVHRIKDFNNNRANESQIYTLN